VNGAHTTLALLKLCVEDVFAIRAPSCCLFADMPLQNLVLARATRRSEPRPLPAQPPIGMPGNNRFRPGHGVMNPVYMLSSAWDALCTMVAPEPYVFSQYGGLIESPVANQNGLSSTWSDESRETNTFLCKTLSLLSTGVNHGHLENMAPSVGSMHSETNLHVCMFAGSFHLDGVKLWAANGELT